MKVLKIIRYIVIAYLVYTTIAINFFPDKDSTLIGHIAYAVLWDAFLLGIYLFLRDVKKRKFQLYKDGFQLREGKTIYPFREIYSVSFRLTGRIDETNMSRFSFLVEVLMKDGTWIYVRENENLYAFFKVLQDFQRRGYPIMIDEGIPLNSQTEFERFIEDWNNRKINYSPFEQRRKERASELKRQGLKLKPINSRTINILRVFVVLFFASITIFPFFAMIGIVMYKLYFG